MKNKKTVQVLIEEYLFPNIGIGYYENAKVKIKNAIIGQKVEVIISKRKKVYEGKLISVIEKAKEEIEPICPHFSECGGCTYQNIPYEYELKIKEKMVLDLLNKKNITGYEFLGIDFIKNFDEYRNKMEFSFGDNEKGGSLTLGMRKRNSFYEVVTTNNCKIVDEDFRSILTSTLSFFKNTKENFYHKSTHSGSLRHLVVRKGKFSNEILINLVTTSNLSTDLYLWVEDLLKLKLDGKVVSILHTTNNSLADVVKVDKLNLLYGKDYYTEHLLDLKFNISAFSFFQTNSVGAKSLYTTVRDFIKNSDNDNKIIFDLYCGTGTIAQILSKNAKQVIGIEIVEEAIENAIQNAKLNGINNCKFIAGDVLKEIDNIDIKPDIIILDPPREGIHKKAISKIVKFNAKEIIYISCKPTSLVEDLEEFIKNDYVVKKIKLHDMFKRTYHIETVVLLSKN